MNKERKNRLVTRADIILIGALVLLALAIGTLSLVKAFEKPAQAEITVNGEHWRTLSLEEDATVRIEQNGHLNIVEIKDGKVHMLEANCPDSLCIAQGEISRTGQSIVCLPARLSVTISGDEDLDAVAG